MFDNMSAIILAQNSLNLLFILRYFGIGSDSFYFIYLLLSVQRKEREKSFETTCSESPP